MSKPCSLWYVGRILNKEQTEDRLSQMDKKIIFNVISKWNEILKEKTKNVKKLKQTQRRSNIEVRQKFFAFFGFKLQIS